MDKYDRTYDLSVLPDDVLTYCEDKFFQLINTLVGNDIVEILKIQSINSTQSFINTKDPLTIFQLDCPDLLSIKERLCFKLSNGNFVIKIGIESSLKYLTAIFKLKQKQNERQTGIVGDNISNSRLSALINRNLLIKSLFCWYNQQQQEPSIYDETFLSSAIDNITNNLSKSSNQYRYNDSVKPFAICLYILGGRLTYEFVRSNIIGLLPSLTTLHGIISDKNLRITEDQFRFDELKPHLDLVDTKFGFISEDCTGIVPKIKYDEQTNSFIGFTVPLTNGISSVNHFQTDSLEQLRTWFAATDKASLLNVHMFQSVPSNHPSSSSPFLLSAFGVNNQYRSIDILKRWSYIYDECCKKKIRIIGFSTGMIIHEHFALSHCTCSNFKNERTFH